MEKYDGCIKWGLIILIVCGILGPIAGYLIGIGIVIFIGLAILYAILSTFMEEEAVDSVMIIIMKIAVIIVIVGIIFVIISVVSIALWTLMGKYLIYTLIGIISIIGLIVGLTYFMRYRFNKKNSDKKLELVDKLTIILEQKSAILDLLCEYEKFKPLIQLLERCCDSELNKDRLSNNNILKSFLNDYEELDISKINTYTAESLQEEITELKGCLIIIQKKLVSKSMFEYINNKCNTNL